MNLTSCTSCGVVLNKDYLNFPKEIFDEEKGCFDTNLCEYNGEEFISKVPCPVCKADILETDA